MPLSKARDAARQRQLRLDSPEPVGLDIDRRGQLEESVALHGSTQAIATPEFIQHMASEWERCNPELAARLKPGERYQG